jgi:hypothetical protein
MAKVRLIADRTIWNHEIGSNRGVRKLYNKELHKIVAG